MLCFVGLPLGIMGNKWFFSSLSSLAREAGGFGCLGGKTNTLPQISSSHSLELVLAKTPLSGDSTKAQANHTFEEGGPQERWGGRLGWSSSGANGGWSGSLSGDVKTESSGERCPGTFLWIRPNAFISTRFRGVGRDTCTS